MTRHYCIPSRLRKNPTTSTFTSGARELDTRPWRIILHSVQGMQDFCIFHGALNLKGRYRGYGICLQHYSRDSAWIQKWKLNQHVGVVRIRRARYLQYDVFRIGTVFLAVFRAILWHKNTVVVSLFHIFLFTYWEINSKTWTNDVNGQPRIIV